MKKQNIRKQMLLVLSCVMLCFALNTQVAQAASAKSTYKVNTGSNELGSKLTIKGYQKKKLTFNVKSKGTIKIMLNGDSTLGKNEKVKMALVNNKGKTVSSSTVTTGKHGYISYNVKPGTYKLVLTTKNIKKSKVRTMKLSYTMNKELVLKTNGNAICDISNKYGNTEFKFVNDKEQVVRIQDISSPSRNITYNVYDSNGKWVCTSKSDDWIGPNVHYLKKGTYRVKVSNAYKDAYEHGKFVARVQKDLSKNLTTNASNKDKAAVYNGKTVNFVHYGKQTKSQTQWLKIDASKGDINLWMTCPGDDELQYRTNYKAVVYDATGKVVKSYEYTGDGVVANVPGGKSEWVASRCISLKKATGVYYIAVTTNGTDIATLTPVK